MSLEERLKSQRTRLKPTRTVVRSVDGKVWEEEMSDGGAFELRKIKEMSGLGYVVDNKPDLQMAEICANLFLGSQDVAADLEILESKRVSHILNVATGIPCFFPCKFQYKSIEMLDLPEVDITAELRVCIDFIDEALERSGKVLVHCNAGISRSATVVIAFLMLRRDFEFQAAFRYCKGKKTFD